MHYTYSKGICFFSALSQLAANRSVQSVHTVCYTGFPEPATAILLSVLSLLKGTTIRTYLAYLMASGQGVILGGDTPPPPGKLLLHASFSPQSLTISQETDEMKLERLLSERKAELRTAKNEIAKIGKGNSYGRLQPLQVTRTRLEKEIEVLDWTSQLYNIANGEKKAEKVDTPTQDGLWTAIADSKLKSQEKVGDEVWKEVGPMLEQLWTALGNKEPYYGSNKTHSTGYEAGK
jgi:hypothetical protein